MTGRTPSVELGTVTTDTAMLAIVGPEMAGVLSDQWTARYLDADGEPLSHDGPPELHELVEFEELELGDEGDRAVLVATSVDGGYVVEGRFADGHMNLVEIRVSICDYLCGCHDRTPPQLASATWPAAGRNDGPLGGFRCRRVATATFKALSRRSGP